LFSVFVFIGAIFDCLVWYYVKDLDLYADADAEEEVKEREIDAEVRIEERNL
jgi:hypothetical protein